MALGPGGVWEQLVLFSRGQGAHSCGGSSGLGSRTCERQGCGWASRASRGAGGHGSSAEAGSHSDPAVASSCRPEEEGVWQQQVRQPRGCWAVGMEGPSQAHGRSWGEGKPLSAPGQLGFPAVRGNCLPQGRKGRQGLGARPGSEPRALLLLSVIPRQSSWAAGPPQDPQSPPTGDPWVGISSACSSAPCLHLCPGPSPGRQENNLQPWKHSGPQGSERKSLSQVPAS